jgi:hypothetical protein
VEGLEAAKTRVVNAEKQMQLARNQAEQEQNRLSGLVKDVGALLQEKPALKKQLEQAANTLGYVEAANTYDALVDLNANLQTFSGRLSGLAMALLRSPRGLVVLTLLVLVLPLAVAIGLSAFAEEMSLIGKRIVELATFLGGPIAGLNVWLNKGLQAVNVVDSAFTEAQTVRRKTVEADPRLKVAQQQMAVAQAAIQTAQKEVDDNGAEVQRLQGQIEELRPERKWLRLLEDRSSSAAYTSQLGIISLIRSDFEQMSEFLVNINVEKHVQDGQEPPIQRIILYIDDLDRCQPERVVQVLEAVHLLLAFPLFVVGVDPRWLRHSLADHYMETLRENGRTILPNGRGTPGPYSTPQDYLEKIFQIPFALRPVEKEGYQKLVADLLKSPEAGEAAPVQVPAMAAAKASVSGGADHGIASVSAEVAVRPIPVPQRTTPGGEEVTPPPSPELKKQDGVSLSAAQLDFQDWEEQDIQMLWPMFHTPRSVKRFVNIYRLLRASLASDDEVADFEGTKARPGEYQVAQVLLAVVTAFPNDATHFLCRLEDWLQAEPTQSPDEVRWRWNDVMPALKASPELTPDKPATKAAIRQRARCDENSTSKREDRTLQEEMVDTGASWESLLACFGRVTDDDFQQPFSKRVARKWADRVARYSFSVQPPQRGQPSPVLGTN